MEECKNTECNVKLLAIAGAVSGLLFAGFVTFSSQSYSLPNPEPVPLFDFEDNKTEIDDSEYIEAEGVREEEKDELKKLVGNTKPTIYTVKKGENFWYLLKRAGFEKMEIHKISQAFSKEFDTRRLMPKHKFEVYKKDNELIAIVFIHDKLTKIIIKPNTDKTDFSASTALTETIKVKKEVEATLDDSFLNVAKKNGIPTFITYQFISAFDGGVNFKRDLRKGDTFKIIYEEEMMPDGASAGEGQILAAKLNLSKKEYSRYFYIDKKGFGDFYDEKGNSAKRFLSVYPLGNARVTSNYGMRFHPILKRRIMHRGVDFRAKIGTPVRAAGDGVVRRIGTNGAYGKYLRISHNGTYSTAYAHLNSFNRKLRIGSRIKKGQIVAYTGNTGRSTGPHLHFELIKGKKKVNPFKEKAVIEKFLSKEEMTEFKKVVTSFNPTQEPTETKTETVTKTDATKKQTVAIAPPKTKTKN